MSDDSDRRARRGEERDRLLTVLEQTSEGVGMADADGGFFYINRAGRRILGIGPEDHVTGWNVNDFHEPEAARDIMAAAASDGAWRGEVELQRLDGSRISVYEVVTAHRDARGAVQYYSTIARDISERKEAERETERLATAIAQITEGIIITDARGTIEYVNDATLEITGYTREELIGENPRLLRSGHQPDAFYEEMWKTISAGEVWQGQLVNRRKDGSFYEEEMIITPIHGADGAIRSYVAAKRDVTERVLLESQLQQAQKMEAVGQLAGGVAHDFNNMLTGITGYAQLLLRAADDEAQRSDLRQILELSIRAADLTQQLLAFSRRQQLEQTPVDLNKLIGSTLKMLRRLIPESIEVEFSGADALQTVMADSGQIVQVLLNLAVNARDAMPDGGTLVIETANVDVGSDYADSHLEVKPGGYVMMSISDNGTGMDQATKDHIFEPFFTTKGTGEGTGLGLATVYGIVKQHGGHINVYSEPGMGTAFKVYLPASKAPATEHEGANEGPPELPEIATVLLVEDEEAVREIVERTLGKMGCHVLSAGRSSEALQLYDCAEHKIDLLLTDVVMPGGLGTDLYRELRALDPDLKVVFMSGYPDRGAAHLTDLPAGSMFLRKPFSPNKLAEYVRQVLTLGA
jgi:PAS domain S-box-containing protein